MLAHLLLAEHQTVPETKVLQLPQSSQVAQHVGTSIQIDRAAHQVWFGWQMHKPVTQL